MMPSSAVPLRYRGFSLLEILVSLIVLTLMLAVGVGYLSQRSDSLANQAVAQQMRRIGDAVDAYAQANKDALTQNISSSNIIPLSPADTDAVKAYLPLGEAQSATLIANNTIQIPTLNPLGIKDYYAKLYVEVSGTTNSIKHIRTLVYTDTGLKEISKNAISIAQMLGAGGFYVDNKDRKTSGQDLSYWNSYGQLDKTTFQDFLTTIPGLGTVLYAPFTTGLAAASSGGGSDEYLCRVDPKTAKIQGCRNTMETKIQFSKQGATSASIGFDSVANLAINTPASVVINGTGASKKYATLGGDGLKLYKTKLNSPSLTLPSIADAGQSCDSSYKGEITVSQNNQLLTCREDAVTGNTTWMPPVSFTHDYGDQSGLWGIMLTDNPCRNSKVCTPSIINHDNNHFRFITVTVASFPVIGTTTSIPYSGCYLQIDNGVWNSNMGHYELVGISNHFKRDTIGAIVDIASTCSVTFIAYPKMTYNILYWGGNPTIQTDTID